MAVAFERIDASVRGWSHHQHGSAHGAVGLEDKFEMVKEIGDGSFGSVHLARVRSAGTYVARRGTLIAVKTMKKQFDAFSQCLELREVIFMRSLPHHPHLVPALDIFLDPMSKKLHIAMEYMDGNLYQLMKARDHKRFDAQSVKSILFQIMAGLEHIHEHNFFHRDIKPENILVSTSAPQETNAFKRYSSLVTPPSTPPAYTIKIADFGLARETHSKMPYTTYVSTRWYRAPEVLLRAGQYSAPVDIWAIGAMAVEIATLRPLFPGGNEVDQVWRVCEMMGSPGAWVNKHGVRIGGGEWKEGVKLAQKLGFSFPRMAPHSLETVLPPPEWPPSFANFVTWCLMWDPSNRPTSTQALRHEYLADAFDPLRPKSNSSSRLLSRKHSDLSRHSHRDSTDGTPSLNSKTSWFRRSLIARESAPSVPQHNATTQVLSPEPSPVREPPKPEPTESKARPPNIKRSTWTNGVPNNTAPIPILPSIKPVSPLLTNNVNAQANTKANEERQTQTKIKVGRQLSVNSNQHYADIHRLEAERALNGNGGPASPTSAQKESFFSHLRKRARRFSGRHSTQPMSPNPDDVEANAGCAPWISGSSNRSSMVVDPPPVPSIDNSVDHPDFTELDQALQNVRYNLDPTQVGRNGRTGPNGRTSPKAAHRVASNPMLKRHHSVPHGPEARTSEDPSSAPAGIGPVSSRTRRAAHRSKAPPNHYDIPDEEEELLDEALESAQRAARRLDRQSQQPSYPPRSDSKRPPPVQQALSEPTYRGPYLTPSPSANRNGVKFGHHSDFTTPTKPLDIKKARNRDEQPTSQWPTPPYEDSEWGAAAAASIFAAGAMHR